jgi:hypothetical protein
MTNAHRLEELRSAAGRVSLLAERCQEDIAVAVVLPDGRVLAPTTAPHDMLRLDTATAELRALLTDSPS